MLRSPPRTGRRLVLLRLRDGVPVYRDRLIVVSVNGSRIAVTTDSSFRQVRLYSKPWSQKSMALTTYIKKIFQQQGSWTWTGKLRTYKPSTT
jgi:hypothetical protein